MQRITITLLCIFINGCAAAPLPELTGASTTDKANSAYKESGHAYCSRLSSYADEAALRKLGLGIVFGALASAAIVAGSAMGPGPDSGNGLWIAKNRNTLFIGAGGILAVPTTLLLTRSNDSSTASAAAGEAMALDHDKDAMVACLKARAVLVNSRSADANTGKNGTTTDASAPQTATDAGTPDGGTSLTATDAGTSSP